MRLKRVAKILTPEERQIRDENMRVLDGEVEITPEYLTGKNVGSRYTETLWTAARLKKKSHVLDAAFSLASLEYLGMLLAAKDRGAVIEGVDIVDAKKVAPFYF